MIGCLISLTGVTEDIQITKCYNYISHYCIMTNPDALWEDMSKLNALYEELMWPPEDKLTIRIEGDHIVIKNLSQEQRDMV